MACALTGALTGALAGTAMAEGQTGAAAAGANHPRQRPAEQNPGMGAADLPIVATMSAPVPATLRPKARNEAVPQARWSHRDEAKLWTRAALSAVGDHGRPLIDMVPGDIATWCPAYPAAGPAQRGAFWVGFMSALAKHESTYRPEAVGGGGLWYGLLQILPSTARGYKCRAGSGDALKDGPANLSCAIRIMAVTVPRDGVIHGYQSNKKRRWRGVSADWGPMRSEAKRADMAGWLRRQSYCKPLSATRPRARPEGVIRG
jgi:hypothetical protein